MLAAMCSELGRFADAAWVVRQALDLARREKNYPLADKMKDRLAYYESHRHKPQLPVLPSNMDVTLDDVEKTSRRKSGRA
jgi:hypothetical protein